MEADELAGRETGNVTVLADVPRVEDIPVLRQRGDGDRRREKHGGEVVVCSAGPTRVQQVIREALARGADRAVHVEDASLGAADAFVTADASCWAMRHTFTVRSVRRE